MDYTHTHATVEDAMTLTCSLAQPATKGQNDGSISILIEGGTPPYFIEWSGPQSGGFPNYPSEEITLPNLSPGSYTIEVTSGNEKETCEVVVPEKQTINAGDCITLGDDLPSTSPEGDTYCYKWSPTTYFDGSSTATDKVITTCPTNTITYTVTVTDGLNITETREYEICVEGGGGGDDCDPNLALFCSQRQAAAIGEANGSAYITIEGGTPPYQMKWTNKVTNGEKTVAEAGNTFIFDLTSGIYQTSVIDANGCTIECDFTIESHNLPEPECKETSVAECDVLGGIGDFEDFKFYNDEFQLCFGNTTDRGANFDGDTNGYIFYTNEEGESAYSTPDLLERCSEQDRRDVRHCNSVSNRPFCLPELPSGELVAGFVPIIEGLIIPLAEPIYPGENITVCLSALTRCLCIQDGIAVTVEFMSADPIPGENIYEIEDGVVSPKLVEPVTGCYYPDFANYDGAQYEFIPLSFEFENPFSSSLSWNYLVIGGAFLEEWPPVPGYLYVDDVQIKKEPSPLQITSSTSSLACPGGEIEIEYEICNPIKGPSREITLDFLLPRGYRLLKIGDFAQGNPTTIPQGAIPPGECITLTATFKTFDNATSPVDISLTASGACYTSATTITTINLIEEEPPLSITKNVTCNPDGTFTVDITVENLTTFESLDGVVIEDVLPDGFTLTNAGAFSQNGNQLNLTTTLGSGSTTFSYTMESSSLICEDNIPAPCAVANINDSGCMPATDCPEIKDCRSLEPMGGFSFNQTACEDSNNALQVSFTSNDTDPNYTHTWDFGDGNTSNAPNPSHTYASVNAYTVTHTVDNGCEQVTTEQIVLLRTCDPVGGDDNFCACSEFTSRARVSGALSDVINDIPNDLGCLEIFGTLFIDITPPTLSNIQIIMDPGASIDILGGNTLHIRKSTIESCESLWNTINVRSNATLILDDNRSIEDGLNAVTLQEDAKYDIRKNPFNKNNVGILVLGTPVALAPLEDNTFDATGSLKTGDSATAGVRVRGSSTFLVGNEDSSIDPQNRFTGSMDAGVLIEENAIVYIDRGAFEDLGIDDESAGVKGDGNTYALVQESNFQNLARGIDFFGTIGLLAKTSEYNNVDIGINFGLGSYNIEDNILNTNLYGIIITGSGTNSQSWGYTIRNKLTGGGLYMALIKNSSRDHEVFWNEINSNTNGIEIYASSNIEVEGNGPVDGTISGIKLSTTSQITVERNNAKGHVGIWVLGSPMNTYCGNTADGGTGISFGGLGSASMAFGGTCSQTVLSRNDIKSADYGIDLYRSAIISPQPNTLNTWSGTYLPDRGVHHGSDDEIFVQRSQFIVDVGTAPPHSPDEIVVEDFIDPSDCQASANINESDALGARSAFASSTTNWETARYLLCKHYNFDDTFGELSPVDSFYLATREEAIGQLALAEYYINTATATDEVAFESGLTDFDSLASWIIQVSALENDYQNATSSAQQSDILQEREALTTQIQQTTLDNRAALNNLLESRKDLFKYAYQINEQIAPTNSFEQNEQIVNRLLIRSRLFEGFEPSETERTDLLNIANLCPSEGGSIVYKARSLYEELEGDTTFDDTSCN
ncbi:MAG: PKD domain-containing protein [Bacteroidota bacterium]